MEESFMSRKISQNGVIIPESTAFREAVADLGILSYYHGKKDYFTIDKRLSADTADNVGGKTALTMGYNDTITLLRPDNFEAFKNRRLQEIEAYFSHADNDDRVHFEMYRLIKSIENPQVSYVEIRNKCHENMLNTGVYNANMAWRVHWENYYNQFRNPSLVVADTLKEVESNISNSQNLQLLHEYQMLSSSKNYTAYATQMNMFQSYRPIAWFDTANADLLGTKALYLGGSTEQSVIQDPVAGLNRSFIQDLHFAETQKDNEAVSILLQMQAYRRRTEFEACQGINNLLVSSQTLQPSSLNIRDIIAAGMGACGDYIEQENPNTISNKFKYRWAQLMGYLPSQEDLQDYLAGQKFEIIKKPLYVLEGSVQAHESVMRGVENADWFKLMQIYYYDEVKRQTAEQKQQTEAQEKEFQAEKEKLQSEGQQQIEHYRILAAQKKQQWEKLLKNNATSAECEAAYKEYVDADSSVTIEQSHLEDRLRRLNVQHQRQVERTQRQQNRQPLFDLIEWYGADDPTNGNLKLLKDKNDEWERLEEAYQVKRDKIQNEYESDFRELEKNIRMQYADRLERAEMNIRASQEKYGVLCQIGLKTVNIKDEKQLKEHQARLAIVEKEIADNVAEKYKYENEIVERIHQKTLPLAQLAYDSFGIERRSYERAKKDIEKEIQALETQVGKVLPLKPEPLNANDWYPEGQYSREAFMRAARRAGLVPEVQDYSNGNSFEVGTTEQGVARFIERLKDNGLNKQAQLVENAVQTRQKYEFMRRYVTRFQKACQENPELLPYLQNQMHERMTPEMRINMDKSNMMDVNLTTNINPLNETCRQLVDTFAKRLVQPGEVADKTFELANMTVSGAVGLSCSLVPGKGVVLGMVAGTGTYMAINAYKDEIETAGWYQDFKRFTSSDEFTKGCNKTVYREIEQCQEGYRILSQQYEAKTAALPDDDFDTAIEYGLRYGSADQRKVFKIMKRGRELEVLKKIEEDNRLALGEEKIKEMEEKLRQNPNDYALEARLLELLPYKGICVELEQAIKINEARLAENSQDMNALARRDELMEFVLAKQGADTGHYFYYAQLGTDLQKEKQNVDIESQFNFIQGHYNTSDISKLIELIQSQQECVASMLEYSNRDMLISAWRRDGALPIEKMPASIETGYDYKPTEDIIYQYHFDETVEELPPEQMGSICSVLAGAQQGSEGEVKECVQGSSNPARRLQNNAQSYSGEAILSDDKAYENGSRDC